MVNWLDLIGTASNMLGVAGAVLAGAKALADILAKNRRVNVELRFHVEGVEVRSLLLTAPQAQLSRAELIGRLAMLVQGGGRLNLTALQTIEGITAFDRAAKKGGTITLDCTPEEAAQFRV